jgi:hypothetical protein
MTTLDELKQQITVLASVEQSAAPFISCYLNLENGQTGWRDVLDERARILRRVLKGNNSWLSHCNGLCQAPIAA